MSARTLPDDLPRIVERALEYFAPRAVVLIGSMARGDWTALSHIDLLVIADDPPSIAGFRDRLATEPTSHYLSLLLYEPNDWLSLWSTGSLFVRHVITEGQALQDDGLLRDSAPFRPKDDYRSDIDDQMAKLRLYEDLTRFDDNYLFVLSHFFSILKNVSVFSLAQIGVIEFNKLRSISRFFEHFPKYAPHRDELMALYDFYVIATKGPYAAPAFPYRGCTDRVRSYHRTLSAMRSQL